LSAIVFGLALGAAAIAQDATAPASNPTPGQDQSQRGGRGGWGGGGGMMAGGKRVFGSVTEVGADHYTIKTNEGEIYTVRFSANTRILKQEARPTQTGGRRSGVEGSNPPQPLKSTDIKVGDAIAAMGEVDADAKSVGAAVILQIDPERARQMREMQANFGKTWLMGVVRAVDGAKVTLLGAIDHVPHTFVADENTTFRKGQEPITLADIRVGDAVRVEGAVKDGTFLATTVRALNASVRPPTVPRDAPPQ
jgi:hypothetical protein